MEVSVENPFLSSDTDAPQIQMIAITDSDFGSETTKFCNGSGSNCKLSRRRFLIDHWVVCRPSILLHDKACLLISHALQAHDNFQKTSPNAFVESSLKT